MFQKNLIPQAGNVKVNETFIGQSQSKDCSVGCWVCDTSSTRSCLACKKSLESCVRAVIEQNSLTFWFFRHSSRLALVLGPLRRWGNDLGCFELKIDGHGWGSFAPARIAWIAAVTEYRIGSPYWRSEGHRFGSFHSLVTTSLDWTFPAESWYRTS